MRALRQLLLLAVAAALGAGAQWLWAGVPIAPDPAPAGTERFHAPDAAAGLGVRRGPAMPHVTAVAVEIRRIADRIAAVGSGRALHSLTLSTRVSGVIEEINIEPGAHVDAGTALVVLENRAERIAVERASAELDEARSAVARYQRLVATNAVSAVQYEQAQTALRVAEANLHSAEYELERTVVRAPFAGVLGLTDLSVGDYLAVGTNITTIDDTSKLIVEFTVPEAVAGQIRLGQAIGAAPVSSEGRVREGVLSAIDSRIDPASRTLRVEAALPNPDARLIPGATFAVDLRLSGNEAPAVPGLSIQWDRSGAHIWKLDDAGSVSRVDVTILRRTGDYVMIEGDVAAGDRVVYEGASRLSAGERVNADTVPGPGEIAPDGVTTTERTSF